MSSSRFATSACQVLPKIRCNKSINDSLTYSAVPSSYVHDNLGIAKRSCFCGIGMFRDVRMNFCPNLDPNLVQPCSPRGFVTSVNLLWIHTSKHVQAVRHGSTFTILPSFAAFAVLFTLVTLFSGQPHILRNPSLLQTNSKLGFNGLI